MLLMIIVRVIVAAHIAAVVMIVAAMTGQEPSFRLPPRYCHNSSCSGLACRCSLVILPHKARTTPPALAPTAKYPPTVSDPSRDPGHVDLTRRPYARHQTAHRPDTLYRGGVASRDGAAPYPRGRRLGRSGKSTRADNLRAATHVRCYVIIRRGRRRANISADVEGQRRAYGSET